MERPIVVDAIVLQDGQNPAFKAYMDVQEAMRIANCGWENAGQILIRDCPERPLPQSTKNGETIISDVLIKMEPNTEYSLN